MKTSLIALIVVIAAVGLTLGCTAGDTGTRSEGNGYFEDRTLDAQDYLTKEVSPDPGSIRVVDIHIESYSKYESVSNILFGYNKSGEPHTSRILYDTVGRRTLYMDIDGVV